MEAAGDFTILKKTRTLNAQNNVTIHKEDNDEY